EYRCPPCPPNAQHASAGEDRLSNAPTSLNKTPCLPDCCSYPGQRPYIFPILLTGHHPHLAPHPYIFCPSDSLHSATGRIWKNAYRPLFHPQNLRSMPNYGRPATLLKLFLPCPINGSGP